MDSLTVIQPQAMGCPATASISKATASKIQVVVDPSLEQSTTLGLAQQQQQDLSRVPSMARLGTLVAPTLTNPLVSTDQQSFHSALTQGRLTASRLIHKEKSQLGPGANPHTVLELVEDPTFAATLVPIENQIVFNNPVEKLRYRFREPLAEFLGTAILIIFGEGAVAQFVLEGGTRGDWLSLSIGWGIGALVAIYVAGGISGAHLNPGVTLALALFRRFPLRKVPSYILSQILGALIGSLIVFLTWRTSIESFEGSHSLTLKTVGIFVTGAQHDYVNIFTAFWAEFLISALLLLSIAAIGDVKNSPPSVGTSPMVLMWVVTGVGLCFGSLTGFALNPARDLGPRMMASIVGYPKAIWTNNHGYGIWLPSVATICGSMVGIFIYDLFIYTGSESPLNARFWAPSSPTTDSEKPTAQRMDIESNSGDSMTARQRSTSIPTTLPELKVSN